MGWDVLLGLFYPSIIFTNRFHNACIISCLTDGDIGFPHGEVGVPHVPGCRPVLGGDVGVPLLLLAASLVSQSYTYYESGGS